MAVRWSLYAGLAVLFATGWTALATPLTCDEVRARIEQQRAGKATPLPPLLIVPKGLAAGSHVVGSCENGTQRIVYRTAVASTALDQTTPAGGSYPRPSGRPQPLR